MRFIRRFIPSSGEITINIPENEEDDWSISTSYSVNDIVQVRTYGGEDYHRIYKCIEASTGDLPPNNPNKWQDLRATNPWKMFDGLAQSQSTNTNQIQLEIVPDEALINSVTLFYMEGTEVQIVAGEQGEGAVYDETFDLTDLDGVDDHYAWFWEPVSNTKTLFVHDLPSFVNADIYIYIKNVGSTAKVGEIVFGQIAQIGATEYPHRESLKNYSKKTYDDDDYAELTVTTTRRSMSLRVLIDAKKKQWAYKQLGPVAIAPTAFIGYDDDDQAIEHGVMEEDVLFGFVKSVASESGNRNKGYLNINIEELV